ncbi:MAG: hypothetical protein ACRCYB_03150, partial [Aeromonas veronii]
ISMSKIDYSKAPDGATHFYESLNGVLWYMDAARLLVWEESAEAWIGTSTTIGALKAIPFKPFTSIEDAQPATAKQPAPSGSGNPILGMVLADLTNRALEGKEKYGEPLKAHNGRNALRDAYQEALDLAMYLRQAIEEQSK